VYDGILKVKQRAGDRGITAENMEKSQHTDFNEDTTNESISVACSNLRLVKAGLSERMNKEARLDAFVMKGLRKILRVSWTAKKTNECVLNKAGVKKELLDTVKARKLAYCGHTMRKQWSCLEKEIMQGTMPGARRQGRPCTAWMDNIIKTWTSTLHWCGQPTDRGRLKIRSDQILYPINSINTDTLKFYNS